MLRHMTSTSNNPVKQGDRSQKGTRFKEATAKSSYSSWNSRLRIDREYEIKKAVVQRKDDGHN